MLLKDLISRIVKTKENQDFVDIDAVANELELYNVNCYEDQDRLKAYWAGSHYCTDQWVGVRVYFFDDEPCAISGQEGRKYDEIFEWVSDEAVQKVREWLITLMDDKPTYTLVDMNYDIGEYYQSDETQPWHVTPEDEL